MLGSLCASWVIYSGEETTEGGLEHRLQIYTRLLGQSERDGQAAGHSPPLRTKGEWMPTLWDKISIWFRGKTLKQLPYHMINIMLLLLFFMFFKICHICLLSSRCALHHHVKGWTLEALLPRCSWIRSEGGSRPPMMPFCPSRGASQIALRILRWRARAALTRKPSSQSGSFSPL